MLKGGVVSVPGMDDDKEWREMCAAMAELGFSDAEQSQLLDALAAGADGRGALAEMALIGDLFYDRTGRLTRAFFARLSPRARATPLLAAQTILTLIANDAEEVLPAHYYYAIHVGLAAAATRLADGALAQLRAAASPTWIA